MTYAIENRGDFYLVELARTRAESSDRDILNLRDEIAGYLVGYFEKKAEKLFNRLTGRQFEVERSKEYWTSLTNSELAEELGLLYKDYKVEKASTYVHDLIRVLETDKVIRQFANAAANSRVAILYLNQKQYNIIFK
jgi:hypothetical protein